MGRLTISDVGGVVCDAGYCIIRVGARRVTQINWRAVSAVR
jgi:hypothetical protein